MKAMWGPLLVHWKACILQKFAELLIQCSVWFSCSNVDMHVAWSLLDRCSTRFWSSKSDWVDWHRWCSLQEAAVFKPMLSTRWRDCDINDLNHLDRIHDARRGWKNYIVFMCSRALSESLQGGVLWKADFSALPSFTRFLYPECQSGIWCNRTF